MLHRRLYGTLQLRLIGTLLVCAAGWLLSAGCGGNLPLTQENVFQAKRSITPGTFDRPDTTLVETEFGSGPSNHGWWFDRDDSRCAMLFFGGQAFHKVLARTRIERVLDRFPLDLFVYDYRGYGQSGGKPRVSGLKKDALAAYDHVVDEFDADCVVAHGHSLGTFLATWVATKRDVDGLVLEAPIVSVERWTETILPWYLGLFIGFDIDPAFEGEDNAERIADVEVPTGLIAGGDDPIAPPSHLRTLRSRAAGEPVRDVTVEGAGHNELLETEQAGELLDGLICDVVDCSSDDGEP